jgi:flagellar hook protein FlgE
LPPANCSQSRSTARTASPEPSPTDRHPLAEITLATFNGQNALQALNGGAYAATTDSGPPIYSATGAVQGSSLEASNVDIATQFSDLVVAQQAYSANAKVMTTADQMIQSLLQVIQ